MEFVVINWAQETHSVSRKELHFKYAEAFNSEVQIYCIFVMQKVPKPGDALDQIHTLSKTPAQ
jgi:hypothetical protein